MEPTFSVGGAVVSREIDPDSLWIGDVIIFKAADDPDKQICHRIVEIQERLDVKVFRTQGDANEHPDASVVPADNVVGRAEYYVPYLGYFANFADSPFGFILLLIVPGLVLVLLEVRNIWVTITEPELGSVAVCVESDGFREFDDDDEDDDFDFMFEEDEEVVEDASAPEESFPGDNARERTLRRIQGIHY
jgi:signal peptidase